jgi:glycosyltransferase involved in cell wall biosynthesis
VTAEHMPVQTAPSRAQRVLVVLPAYNAERTITLVHQDLSRFPYDLLLCDDCSTDRTVAVAQSLGIPVIRHEHNRGYGGNQKTLYAAALQTDADIIVMVHPDYQYDPTVIPHMVAFIEAGICDVILGNRIRTRRDAIAGGMPLWKYLVNRASSLFENILLGQNLGEWHSGLRAYSRRVLETIPWERNSDDFAFDQQFLMQCVFWKFRIGDVPVGTRYFREASSINLRRSVVYGMHTLCALGQLLLAQAGIARCAIFRERH